MSVPLLSGKVFLLITGASRGFGKQIAESFAPLLGDGSTVLLLARSESGLKETASKLPKGIKVHTEGVDLGNATADRFRDIIGKALGAAGAEQFEKAVIVHNAAWIGDLTKSTSEMTDLQIWRDYYDLNVFSPAVLNGVFMEYFNDTKFSKLVINISSSSQITPYPSMGYYCSGKAARAMYFKVFAVENPEVNVLIYAPGPIETDMWNTAVTEAANPRTKAFFEGIQAGGHLLTTKQTVDYLIELLKSQKYKSAEYVAYSDSPQDNPGGNNFYEKLRKYTNFDKIEKS